MVETVVKSVDHSYGIDLNNEGLAAFWPLTRSSVWPVRRRPRDRPRSAHSAGARHVLDHHRLAKRIRHLLRDGARGDVAEAAGTEADDDLDRPRRIVLGVRRRQEADGDQAAAERHDASCEQGCSSVDPTCFF
jgi:hypothetical protein